MLMRWWWPPEPFLVFPVAFMVVAVFGSLTKRLVVPAKAAAAGVAAGGAAAAIATGEAGAGVPAVWAAAVGVGFLPVRQLLVVSPVGGGR